MWYCNDCMKKIRSHIKALIVLAAAAILVVGGLIVLWASTLELPDLNAFADRKISQSTKIYDRTGQILLYDVHQNIRRSVVTFDNISPNIKNATIAIEDSNFYNNYGVEPKAILRAIFTNITAGSATQGGSTITQQVIKNSLLSQEKSITRKIKEAILAIKLSQVMSKDDILTMYLNETPYGGNIYGIEEAARSFFGKSARDLDLTEAAYLAAVPNAPTYYSPYGNHRDKLEDRKNLVLQRMYDLKFISESDYSKARAEKIVFKPDNTGGIKAPHFVMMVRSYLEEKYGKDAIENKGFKVTTTLDWDLQQKAEQIVAEGAKENETKFNARNASMVAIDPKTGQILVMVGSRDYFDTKNDGNFNIALAHRQPGSSFKPFVYATAFEKGYTPETVVFDVKTQFQTTCDTEGKPLYPNVKEEDCYMPENYDQVYKGPVTLRSALAESRNIPAIKVLYLAGIQDSLNTAKSMGINSLGDASQYGLTLVLGGGEVSLLDMTSAYSVFANDGVRNPYASILKVEDLDGNTLEEFSASSEQVIPQNVSRQITDILSDNAARTPEFGADSALYIPERQVAVKTGTTNDYKDAWIIGYTPDLVVGAWAGNNDNTPMEKKIAGFIVAPMWHSFVEEAIKQFPDEPFPKPVNEDNYDSLKPVLRGIWQGGESYFVDKISGKLANEYTPSEMREERVIPSVHDILYWVDKNNPLGPKPVNPASDPQFNLWETPVRAWAVGQGLADKTADIIPKESDNTHRPEYAPVFTITSPSAQTTYPSNELINVSLQIERNQYPIDQIDYFLNGTYLGSSKEAPFNFSFIPNESPDIKPQNNLRVIVYDSVGNKSEATVPLNLSI
jgi:1A family penicillin-binding protein